MLGMDETLFLLICLCGGNSSWRRWLQLGCEVVISVNKAGEI